MFTKPGPATSTRATSPPRGAQPLGELLGDRARRLAQRLRQQHRGVAREVPVLGLARRLERELGRRTRVARLASRRSAAAAIAWSVALAERHCGMGWAPRGVRRFAVDWIRQGIRGLPSLAARLQRGYGLVVSGSRPTSVSPGFASPRSSRIARSSANGSPGATRRPLARLDALLEHGDARLRRRQSRAPGATSGSRSWNRRRPHPPPTPRSPARSRSLASRLRLPPGRGE